MIEHRDWCNDKTVRTTDSIFDRTVTRHHCLGCGVQITVRKAATK